MELFWLLAGMLSTVAALFVLLPWLRTIPHLGPLPTVSWPVAVSGALALAAVVGLYLKVGSPDLSARPSARASTAAPVPATGNGASMTSAISSLESRLTKGGGTADDWELLAKSYDFLGRPDDAARARARQLPATPPTLSDKAAGAPAPAMPAPAAPALTPDSLKLLAQASAARRSKKPAAAVSIYAGLAANGQMSADSWADYADAAASLQGNRLAGDPETYIARALALDPQHPKALWLKASADDEAGRYHDAIGVWRQLVALLEPNSADSRIVSANLQQDLRLASASAAVAANAAPAAAVSAWAAAESPASAASAATGRVVSGEVALADALRGRVANGQTLFIFAKSVDAPGIPLAVYRGVVGAWPVKFTLDDSQAMMPGRNLSSAARVTVEARLSRSGQALAASGDLSGTSPTIDPSAREPLKILIDRVIP